MKKLLSVMLGSLIIELLIAFIPKQYLVYKIYKSKSIVDFVIIRYEIWSGRIACEFFISIFLYYLCLFGVF